MRGNRLLRRASRNGPKRTFAFALEPAPASPGEACSSGEAAALAGLARACGLHDAGLPIGAGHPPPCMCSWFARVQMAGLRQTLANQLHMQGLHKHVHAHRACVRAHPPRHRCCPRPPSCLAASPRWLPHWTRHAAYPAVWQQQGPRTCCCCLLPPALACGMAGCGTHQNLCSTSWPASPLLPAGAPKAPSPAAL